MWLLTLQKILRNKTFSISFFNIITQFDFDYFGYKVESLLWPTIYVQGSKFSGKISQNHMTQFTLGHAENIDRDDKQPGSVTGFVAILLFCIQCATSVLVGKGTKLALHHGKMLTTKRRAIQILHISTFQFTFKCGYNDFYM